MCTRASRRVLGVDGRRDSLFFCGGIGRCLHGVRSFRIFGILCRLDSLVGCFDSGCRGV